MYIDEDQSFVLETDASNVASSVTLNQNRKPVAFFSRSLNKPQKMYPKVEKEAMTIIEGMRHWSHFLRRKKFKLITDQRAVAYMLNNFKESKIKTSKSKTENLNCRDIDLMWNTGQKN